MKKYFLFFLLLIGSLAAICQTKSEFATDAEKAHGAINIGAFKNNYKYLLKYDSSGEAAINVSPNTSYLLFFVYDNTHHPVPRFEAHLMTPDSALMKKYTVKPFDRGQMGVARVAQMQFHTPAFTGGDTRPVKLNAKPPAIIYVFYK